MSAYVSQLRPFRHGVLLLLPVGAGAAVVASSNPLEPDGGYYTRGLHLFPSPLGTAIGSLDGYSGLAAANGLATAATLLLVASIAREFGSRPLAAQALTLLVIPFGWFQSSAMDVPGAALLLGATLLWLRGRPRKAAALAVLAAATHLAILPLVLGALLGLRLRRSTILLALALAVAGGGVALATSYRASLVVAAKPGSLAAGAWELLLACWPLLLLAPVALPAHRVRGALTGVAAGAVVAGALPAALGQPGQSRYAVPCLLLALPALRLHGFAGRVAQALGLRTPPAALARQRV